MTRTRKMHLRRRPWVLCLLTVAMLPTIARSAMKSKPINGYGRRRSLQVANIPPNIPENIFRGGKGKGTGKGNDCLELPTPTSSPAPTKVKKTKSPTVSPAPSITASPTKGGKAKTKAPTTPTVSPRPTFTPKPTKYPKYCSEEEPTLSPVPPTFGPSDPPVIIQTTLESTRPPTRPPIVLPTCDAIAAGIASTDLDVVNFSIDFLVVITGNVEETLQRIEQFLQQNVATALAGCADTDTGRRLQADANIVNVKFDVEEDAVKSGTCSTVIENGSCVGADVNVDVYHNGGFTDGFITLLRATILDKCGEMKALEGVAAMLDPCSTLEITRNTPDDDNGFNRPVAGVQVLQEPDDKGLGAGGFVAVAGTGLILILFLLLFVRRRHSDEYSLKHRQLEDMDMDDDDTYLKDIDGDTNTSPPGSVYDNRNTYIVGEDESIMTGWTGNNGNSTLGGDDNYDPGLQRQRPLYEDYDLAGVYGHRDVHQCSSAMCNVCERQRRSGLQFIPSGMPSHSSLPDNVTRTYHSSDTVQL